MLSGVTPSPNAGYIATWSKSWSNFSRQPQAIGTQLRGFQDDLLKRSVVGLLITLEQRTRLFPSPSERHVHYRHVLSLSCELAPERMPEAAP